MAVNSITYMTIPSLTSAQRAFLKSKARALKADIHVGKAGLSGQAIEHVRKLLEQRELVKVRLLVAAGEDRMAAAEQLAAAAGAALVDLVGRVVVMYRPSRTLQGPARIEPPQ
jgi:RNA-binding protein